MEKLLRSLKILRRTTIIKNLSFEFIWMGYLIWLPYSSVPDLQKRGKNISSHQRQQVRACFKWILFFPNRHKKANTPLKTIVAFCSLWGTKTVQIVYFSLPISFFSWNLCKTGMESQQFCHQYVWKSMSVLCIYLWKCK